MSARIEEVLFSQSSADGSTRYILAVIQCDTAADLPGINSFTGATLVQGSKAHDIAQNAWYMMQSGGTWVLQDAGSAAYTKAETDALLSDRMPLKNADYTPLTTAGTWDLFALPVGVYYRTSNITDVSNIPTGLNVAFFAIVQNTVGSNRRQIILYPCTQATVGEFYRCIETGSGYGSWYKFSGTVV